MDDQTLNTETSDRFLFSAKENPATPLLELPTPRRSTDQKSLERIQRAVEAVGEATYHWVIGSDEITWSPNADRVLGCHLDNISSGRAYASLLDAENFTSRYDTVMRTQNRDGGEGVGFQIEYLFRPEGKLGKSSVWLEDHGKWFADSEGKPFEVYGTIRKIDDRHNRDQHLSFLGNCDPLTGMMNRGRMAEALGESITVAIREQGTCAFVIAAVNNLAVVNEAYGFEVSDEVIVAMGRRLRQVMRAGDGIARYSGSKFGIILNACSEIELESVIERLLSVARESVIETQHGPVWAMLSIGALCIPTHARDANAAMARAEEALTEARRQPSDGYMVYRPSAKRTAERQLNARCATEIVSCLKEERFKLAYQPIIVAQTKAIHMHEALLRMSDESGEMIAAAHLIPIAEKLGLVRLIDRSVLQTTLATLYAYPTARLAINVSGITAMDPRWYTQITELINENPSVAERLTVEITETVALHDLTATKHFVETLRKTGCSVAIDDFGAGYTSFRNIRELPINILKLDGSFCVNLQNHKENQYFVQASIEMAGRFGLKTVAEWVETAADAETLTRWNVDFLQGNYFGAASLDIPWQKTEDLRFNLSPEQSLSAPPNFWSEPTAIPAQKPEVEIKQEAPIADELLISDEITPANVPVVAPQIKERPLETVEDNLSQLRAAIDILNLHFPVKKAEDLTAPNTIEERLAG